ncbi:MAG: PfkB family carbohydrate kinase, partial [Desulfobacteraceae bacterium]
KRTIFYEGNHLPALTPTAHLKQLCLKARTILLDPETTYLATWLQSISSSSVKLIYDCERWRDGMADMMKVADFFIPSVEFLNDPMLDLKKKSLEGKMRELRQQLHGELIVTLGAEGAAYLCNDHFFQIPAFKVHAVDTTGAGDNFHGAFALAISWEMDIHQAVRFAIAVASLSCQGYGGRVGLPDLEQAKAAASSLP